MKRSEMVDIIELAISTYFGEKVNHPDLIANVVLDDIEKAGMLPPLVSDGDPWQRERIGSQLEHCRWEPEGKRYKKEIE